MLYNICFLVNTKVIHSQYMTHYLVLKTWIIKWKVNVNTLVALAFSYT